MKKLLLAAAILGISTSAFAANNGFYAGGQVGWANTGDTVSLSSLSDNFDTFTSNYSNNVFDGGVFMGYQFNPNFAAQLGYTKLSNSKSSFSATTPIVVSTSTFPYSVNTTLAAHGTGTVKTQIVDLTGKVIYPIGCTGYNVYGKAGAAYIDDHGNLSQTITVQGFGTSTYTDSADSHAVRPEVGAGVSYDITHNLVANVEYTYINGNNTIDSINAVTAGLAYHFA
jgi:OmpA-OmpF porin, OOP family